MNRLLNISFLVSVAGLLTCAGCSHLNHTGGQGADHADAYQKALQEKIVALEQELIGLGPPADRGEAHRVAATAITYSIYLADRYELVRPPILHNLLVRLKIKERGLCYQWTEDLLRRLQELRLTSYQLHWGVAHRGSQFREHNTVVITANGQPFENGIVLDPWRDSGELYWVRVDRDSYPWRELPPQEQ
jgi:hypothetical protein